MQLTAPSPQQSSRPATSRPPLPLPRPASTFSQQTELASRLAGQADELIGQGWQPNADTAAAKDALAAALQALAGALGQPAPARAVSAARDGEAFLRQALTSMAHIREDVTPEVARPFVSAAVTSLDRALREYSRGLEPTPPYI